MVFCYTIEMVKKIALSAPSVGTREYYAGNEDFIVIY